MPVKTLEGIRDILGEDLSYVNRIDVSFADTDNHYAFGIMSYWISGCCDWNAEVEEVVRVPALFKKKTVDKTILVDTLKSWGVKPFKLKWSTPAPKKWEDCYKLITSTHPYFFYAEVIREEHCNGYYSIRVEYDTLNQSFKLVRNWYVSGDPDDIAKLFINYIGEIEMAVKAVQVDYMAEADQNE